MADLRKDTSTLCNSEDAVVRHLKLDLDVDFKAKVLSGTAEWDCEVLIDGTQKIVFDTLALDIANIKVNEENATWNYGQKSPLLGTPLEVSLPLSLQSKGSRFSLKIQYKTSKDTSAAQWLEKEQTAEKKYPYLFTQCQAIHCRSLVPTQDEPGVKFTYEAKLTTPDWAVALMSAVSKESTEGERERKGGKRVFHFEQKNPISSYLIAIVVGHLESRSVGPRSSVWCEPSLVDAVAYEFGETETFLSHAEAVSGQEYVWGTYDIVCLPPSFPFGGMENPCLTFVTPTLIAGDRSLADVVAHEIAHSWTGNLITNQTWDHFWLNEGWTMWLQRKIMARIHGEKFFDFDAIIGWKSLMDAVEHWGPAHQYTALIPRLNGDDPDNAFGSVPYEKGFNFLYYLSNVGGGDEAFEGFFKAYIQEFKFKTLTSEDFKNFYIKYFSSRGVSHPIDWDAWFLKPGMPPVTPQFDTSLSSAAFELSDRWLDGGEDCASEDIEGWSTSQKVIMLERIITGAAERKQPLSVDLIMKMDMLYGLSAVKNSEVRFRWQQLCLKSQAEFIVPHVIAFLKEQGRMKFVRPLFRQLYSWDKTRTRAVSLFEEIKDNYHPICRKMLAKDLELDQPTGLGGALPSPSSAGTTSGERKRALSLFSSLDLSSRESRLMAGGLIVLGGLTITAVALLRKKRD